MVLTYNQARSRYEVKTTWTEYQEHGSKLTGARLRWDPTTKVWWTANPENASLLISCADDATRILLQDHANKRESSLEASRAHDANIDLGDLGLVPYPFQRAGIAYAICRDDVYFGDEPGLGKTLQSLATVHLKKAYPCIAVVPASLKINWRKEAIRAVPELREEGAVIILKGRNGNLDLGKAKLIIVNYDILSGWLDQLIAIKAQALILDESHYVKNPKALRTQAAIKLSEGIKQHYLLSGTPLPNRPKELEPQLRILRVLDKFGGSWGFFRRHCAASKQLVYTPRGPQYVWDLDGASHLDELQRKLRQYVMVRRLKQDVLTELPPKRWQVIEVDPEGLSDIVEAELETNEKWQEEIARLQVEQELACANNDRSSFEDATARLKTAYEASFAELARLAHEVALAKAPRVVELALESLEGGVEKLVLFAHHHDVVDAIKAGIESRGIKTVVLTGRESASQKDAAVVGLQEGDARVFIGSLHASGLGLTLVASHLAIMAELDWTPGVMDQAADRLHRIGQTHPVLIQMVVIEGSLDSKKVGMLLEKREVLASSLDKPLKSLEVPADVPKERKAPREHEYSDAERAACLACLRVLAGSDTDYAQELNDVGFNKLDCRFGHSLAGRTELTDKQTKFAKIILKKYWRQLPPDAFKVIYPDFKARSK